MTVFANSINFSKKLGNKMDEDEEFFEDNTFNVNKLVSKILLLLNFIAPLLWILSYFKIFNIELKYIIFYECICLPFTVINLILVYCFRKPTLKATSPEFYEKIQHVAKYFGLVGSSVLLGLMGTHAHIGIYIAYGLIAFLSCLYYNVRTTLIISLIDYVIMIFSRYGKSVSRFAENLTEGNSILHDCIAFSAGFTIEFIFVILIACSISKRSGKTLNSAIERSRQLEKTQLDFMKFVPIVLKKHELVTGFHVEHTVEYVRMLCNQLKAQGLYTEELTQKNIELFSAAANLHDIGKIYIPDHILMKPGKFTPEEYAMMKKHPEIGAEIIEAMPKIFDGEFNKIASQMALCHHERWDGTGYPNGLKAEEIPLCARIMAVADVTDALLSYRPYKNAFSIDKTMQIIEEGKGTQFEAKIADAMISLKPLVMMYANERNTAEKDLIAKEAAWREQERESLLAGRIISEEEQKHMQ